MNTDEAKTAAEFIYRNLRLKTLPVAAAFRDREPQWPEKVRRPSRNMGKRITLCQAMTLARTYGWTVGLTAEDIVCVPALIAFGHARGRHPGELLRDFFVRVGWSKDESCAEEEVSQMSFMPGGQAHALLLAPLAKMELPPDTAVIYGNPAQIMRLVHAWTYMTGHPVESKFSGKIECSEYLTAPYLNGQAKVILPGNGDRIMSGTQDEEMIFALPGEMLGFLGEGLERAGRSVGARYPVPFYQAFQPEFPEIFRELAEKAGLDME
jgi:uncharacterized protein (DUF169 family)